MTPNALKRAAGAAAVLALLPLVVACGGGASAPAAKPTVGSAPTTAAPPRATAPPSPAAPALQAAPTAVAPLSPRVAVKVGIPYLLADVPFYVALDRGYFAEEGLDVELLRTPSLNEVIPAVSTGEMEVAAGGIGAALFNAVARGLPMRMVADRGTVSEGNGYMALMVRKDLIESGRVRDLPDIRGLSFAVSSAGAITELVTYKAAERAGLRQSDIQTVYLGIADTPAAMASRTVDGAMALEPNVTLILNQGTGEILRTAHDITPNLTISVVLYAERFIRDRPEAARRFMVGYLRAMRDFNDAFFHQRARHRAEVLAALTNHTAVKDPAVYERMTMPGLHPNGAVNLASIADAQDWWADRGEVQTRVNLQQLWDGSYIDYAVSRLGRYE